MNTILRRVLIRVLQWVAGATALLPLCSCMRVEYVSTNSQGAALNYVTNITQTGEIPAALTELQVENQFGALEISPADSDKGNWSWTLTIRAVDEAAAREAAQATHLERTPDGDRLRLSVHLPNTEGRLNFESALQVRAPRTANVITHNRFGSTSIADLENSVEAHGQNGAVEIRHIGGKVRADTSFASLIVEDCGEATLNNRNGKIEAADIRGALEAETSFATLQAKDIQGSVTLKNRNGAIRANQIRGDADCKTSFARLSAADVHGTARLANQNGAIEARGITGNTTAETSFASLNVESSGREIDCQNRNGSVRVKAASSELTKVNAKTSFATLEVRLPESLHPAVQAHTSFGNVESDFPVLMKPRGQDPFADVEADTPRVTLENQNGNIRVIRERSPSSR